MPGCHEFTLQLAQGPSMQSKISCAVRVQSMQPLDFEIKFPGFRCFCLTTMVCWPTSWRYDATALDLSHSDAVQVTASRALLTVDGMVGTPDFQVFPGFVLGSPAAPATQQRCGRRGVHRFHQPMQLPRPDPTVNHPGSSFNAHPGLPVDNPQFRLESHMHAPHQMVGLPHRE